MSTDSSELTFVRCPSCRSLVPAASSRCKMCGASLDASAQPDQGEEERKKSGRVRQHTMTQASSELNSAADQVRADDFTEEELDDDPFDIFDMSDEEEGDADQNAEPAADDAAEGMENPLSSFLPEDEPSAAPTEPEVQPEQAVIRKTQAPGPTQSSSQAAPSRATNAPGTPPSKRFDKEAAPKPKVSIESGGRPQGKPSNLSFSKKEPVQNVSSPGAPSQAAPVQPQARVEARPVETPRPKASTQHERPQAVHPNKGETHKMASEGGKLIGWFVSYESSEGAAIELREGRFFISGSRLKPSDLVLDNRGLSTPHALASISQSAGFKVQDLMSDGGLFVKKKNAATFSKEESSVQLDHGDWVKFGEAEFLVALIANGK